MLPPLNSNNEAGITKSSRLSSDIVRLDTYRWLVPRRSSCQPAVSPASQPLDAPADFPTIHAFDSQILNLSRALITQ